MANQQYADQKCQIQYSKGAIDRAGESIRDKVQGEARAEAIKIIQSFREFHLYPLMLLKNHLARTSKKVGRNIIVARRLKRLPTILDKLERPTLNGIQNNTIRITTMQDIAGCRAIVKNKKQLFDLLKRLEESRSVHRIISSRDYLSNPKDDGYGGIHLIYSCYRGQEAEHIWKGAKVEVQLRTELQHAWATSLEIIDTLKGMNLKTGREGHEDWRTFFAIAGKIVAHREGLCTIEQDQLLQFKKELTVLEKKLNAIEEISRFVLGITFANHPQFSKRNGDALYLITSPKQGLNIQGGFQNIKVYSYMRSESEAALRDLNKAELDDNISLSVLVSVQNARTLKQAYPNYFGSTREFTKFIRNNLVQV